MTNSVHCNLENVQIKSFKYRWLIIALYGLNTGVCMFQNGQYTIIADKIQDYYGVSNLLITLTKMVSMAALVVFIVPAVYITEKYSLRQAHVIAGGLTFLGNLLKMLSLSPERFYIVLIGQTLCGIAQVFLMALPAKIVAVWCPAEEQNRACGIAIWGGLIGTSLGGIIPVLLIQDLTTNDEIEEGLFNMLLGNAIFSGMVFLAILILFKAKPALPPSIQQCDVDSMKIDYKENLRELSKNIEFYKLLGVFGAAAVLNGAFGSLQNQIYKEYFPDYMDDLAIVNFSMMFASHMLGNLAVGYLLDKTLQYKWMSVGILVLIALAYVPFAIFLEMRTHICGIIAFIVWQFFSGLPVNISFQYIAEVTYPVSGLVTLSVLMTAQSLFTLIVQVLFVMLIDAKSFMTFHIIMFSASVVVALCSFALSPKLKRMLIEKTDIK